MNWQRYSNPQGPEMTYYEWLQERNFKVSQEDYASHRHFLQRGDEARQVLDRLLGEHAGSFSFPVSKFNKEERAVLYEALKILQRTLVPVALLSVEGQKLSPLKIR